LSTEITGEIIKSAIARKISSDFALANSQTKIYKEKIVQNWNKPCFFIWTVDVSQEKLMNNNYSLIYQMNVRFHPRDDDKTTYETLCGIGTMLFETLSEIELPLMVYVDGGIAEQNKPVRGTQMSYQVTDDVLQFFVTYTLKVMKGGSSRITMENLEVNT
jgi:hypothetical protein